ncbi:MAG: ABC transporter ATP-binding protein [Thermoflexales bacterium]|nr:ABC transporter ATP-binding protein [Thermoflexales bacterium]
MENKSCVVETRNLCKAYGDKLAVGDLSLEVGPGEVFGFLGPNGAGKTTSVKMLLGLVAPSGGTARVMGHAPGDPRARAKVGFLPEHFRFHEWLEAAEFLRTHGRMYGIPAASLEKRVNELLELVGLAPHRAKKLRSFSKGMLQRIGLAQALLNEPELVFLDEPTSGLDPVGRRLVRDIIRQLKASGTAVFLNSHLLSEVEITCDRVAFIKQGSVVRVAELQRLVDGETSVTLRLGHASPALIEGLARWGRDVRHDGQHVHLAVDDESKLPAIAAWIVEQGGELYAMTPQKLSLEDLFLQVVGTDGGL